MTTNKDYIKEARACWDKTQDEEGLHRSYTIAGLALLLEIRDLLKESRLGEAKRNFVEKEEG